MRKFIFSIILFLASISLEGFSQQKSPKEKKKPDIPFHERLIFGGNLGLQFGDITFIDASPLVGYKVTEKLIAGVGLTYIYIKYNSFGGYNTNIYGGRVFSRFFMLDNIFLHGEVESLNGQWDYFTNRRFYVTNVLAGGGYRQALGPKAFANLTVLWNFNESAFSPYANPIIRGGVTFGL